MATIETISQFFRKARSVNQTSTSFVSKVPVNAQPAADSGSATASAAIDLANNGIITQNSVLICPYALASNNDTFSVRVIGWRRIGTEPTSWLWVPVLLAEIACTCGTSVGVAGMQVLNTEAFADTITLTAGNDNVSIDRNSLADNLIAHVVVDMKGSKMLELSFSTESSSATSCNALIAFL